MYVRRLGRKGRIQGDQIGIIWPFGRLFSLGIFTNKYKCIQKFWAAIFRGKIFISILAKICWATFWAIISQIHLVTVAAFFRHCLDYKFWTLPAPENLSL
jgi:hypothetical protein